MLIFSLRHKISLKKLCDTSVIGLALGQAIGRWGNFFNSEAYGLPTNLPWKLYIAPQYRVIPFQDISYYHPTFLYESILDLIIFGILLHLLETGKYKKDGNLALIYLILYSIARIMVELFGIPVAIIMSICIITVSAILLFVNSKKEKDI